MIDGKKVLGIILARGGSKGLPGKNKKPLLGKPLIVWTIEQAKNSKYMDKILVSSDDEEILEISRSYFIDVIKRPEELARDESPSSDAVLHAIQILEKNNEYYDIIVLLEPTSPLRKKNDIDNALEKFVNFYEEADSMVSVGMVHLENPYVSKIMVGNFLKPLIQSDIELYQRQLYPEVYFPNGVLYISKTESFKVYKTFYTDKTLPYLTERWQNFEIDDLYDFICVEAIIKYFYENIGGMQ